VQRCMLHVQEMQSFCSRNTLFEKSAADRDQAASCLKFAICIKSAGAPSEHFRFFSQC
jgi:hypothetical protein